LNIVGAWNPTSGSRGIAERGCDIFFGDFSEIKQSPGETMCDAGGRQLLD
jgi:hypothetical protein